MLNRRGSFIAAAVALVLVGLAWAQPAEACGGFFCTTVRVDQNAERIIFSQNGDGTISAYVQIEYTGAAPDFSWILPLPEAIDASDVQVPEDGMAAFREIETVTNPIFVRPPLPECALPNRTGVAAALADSVEVVASGEAGPYGFDVVRSDDPDALVVWLRENGYLVTEPMEPLIDLYVDEGFVFLAMKLRPGAGVQDIEPVQVTYRAESPMIPLRLTAVAANPDMAVLVWIYADTQATPLNYARMAIPIGDLILSGSGGDNYRALIGEHADRYNGQAFVTEYAGPTSDLVVNHPLLRSLGDRFSYVTRLNTVISPDEMTVDPVFGYDAGLNDVSNVRDLTKMRGLYECERLARITISGPVVTAAGSATDSTVAAGLPGPPGTGSERDEDGVGSGSGGWLGFVVIAMTALALMLRWAWLRGQRS